MKYKFKYTAKSGNITQTGTIEMEGKSRIHAAMNILDQFINDRKPEYLELSYNGKFKIRFEA